MQGLQTRMHWLQWVKVAKLHLVTPTRASMAQQNSKVVHRGWSIVWSQWAPLSCTPRPCGSLLDVCVFSPEISRVLLCPSQHGARRENRQKSRMVDWPTRENGEIGILIHYALPVLDTGARCWPNLYNSGGPTVPLGQCGAMSETRRHTLTTSRYIWSICLASSSVAAYVSSCWSPVTDRAWPYGPNECSRATAAPPLLSTS